MTGDQKSHGFDGEEDTEVGDLEDIKADEFDRLQLRTSILKPQRISGSDSFLAKPSLLPRNFTSV